MSPWDYLAEGILDGGKLRDDLAHGARSVANAWVAEGVAVARVEILAEYLARWASFLGEDEVGVPDITSALAHLSLDKSVIDFLEVALGKSGNANRLAALAIHLVDVAEAMALEIFVPELPALSAKADRSGDAARNVGVARHLKG